MTFNANFCIGIFVAVNSYLLKNKFCLKKNFLADKRETFKNKLLIHDKSVDNLTLKTVNHSNNSRRGFLAGMFLCCGTLTNPSKSYNLEFINHDISDAELIKKMFGVFSIEARIAIRKEYFVNYIHEAELISKFLKLVRASQCLMEFENIRIFKELRSDINRSVNFETANLNKTIKASFEIVQDIKYIINKVGLNYLSDDLKSIALYRLKYRHASLKEIGEKCRPKLNKSSVHYKLKAIKIIASELRKKYGG